MKVISKTPNIPYSNKTHTKHSQQFESHEPKARIINFYNINQNKFLNKTQQITKNLKVNDIKKVYDTSMKLNHIVIKDKHDLMLEEDLKIYKAEVEKRFKNSEVNSTYKFPRKEVEKESYINSEENKMISIYDNKKSLVIPKKTQSLERNHRRLKVSSYLSSILQHFLNDINHSKISFCNVKKTDTNKEPKTSLGIYTLKIKKVNKRNKLQRQCVSHSEESKAEERSKINSFIEVPAKNNVRRHMRTQTYSSKEVIKPIKDHKYKKNVTKEYSNKFTEQRGHNVDSHLTTKPSLVGYKRGRKKLATTMNMTKYLSKV